MLVQFASAQSALTTSEMEVFSHNGPSFLTAVDWSNSHHRRSVAASLVQGVYSLEHDRYLKRQGPQGLAPAWWQSFNFRLLQLLIDDHDVSYFGAVYELVDSPQYDSAQIRPPQYVVAFRGTIPTAGNREEDFKLDLHLVFNNLRSSRRFQIGLKAAADMVERVGPARVWLAGHSLGSSLALVAGREMVKNFGIHLETYLFNPPFVSPPIERLPSDTLKLGIRLASSVLTAGFAAAAGFVAKKNRAREDDAFVVLSTWIPYLFVSPWDPISCEYVGYFKHRQEMEAVGAGKIEKLATKHSIGSILASAAGKKDCEAVHLIPSAYLTVNVTPPQSIREAHGIDQWWRRDLQFDYKYYQHKD